VQVLSRAPNRESEAGRALHAVANRWVPSSRHGLRVVRSPPIQRLACGVLSRLEPDDDPLRVVSVRLAQPLPTLEGEVRRRAPSFRKRVASVRVCGSRPTAFRQFRSVNPAGSGGCPESRPCRLRHVTRAHRAPPVWVGPRSEVRVSKARK